MSATDADGDVLLYSLRDTLDLEDGEDNARFTIDPRSGQIKVGKKLGADPAVTGTTEEREDESTTATEVPGLPETNAGANSEYVLIVRATDPSGAPSDVNVIVTVTEVPEAPAFTETVPTTLWVTEGTGRALRTGQTATTSPDPDNSLASDTDAYVATDDDGEIITYSVVEPGVEDNFGITPGTAVLTINAAHTPNYRGPKSSYSITIAADTSVHGARDSLTSEAGALR